MHHVKRNHVDLWAMSHDRARTSGEIKRKMIWGRARAGSRRIRCGEAEGPTAGTTWKRKENVRAFARLHIYRRGPATRRPETVPLARCVRRAGHADAFFYLKGGQLSATHGAAAAVWRIRASGPGRDSRFVSYRREETSDRITFFVVDIDNGSTTTALFVIGNSL